MRRERGEGEGWAALIGGLVGWLYRQKSLESNLRSSPASLKRHRETQEEGLRPFKKATSVLQAAAESLVHTVSHV